jgi:2-polyprenyl-6-hydroxyphenyl methylase/3-demethylubiquinone-9 3-methyltransferase
LAKAGADVVLVDAEDNALRTARLYAQREGVSASVRTIQSLAFPSSLNGERFDIVIAKDIVEHVEEDQQFLLDVSRCQAPSGMLILSTQSSLSLNYLIEGTYQKYWRGNRDWRGWDQTHVRFYTPALLRRRLAIADYRPDRWASVFLVPYNLPSWLLLLKANIEVPALHYLDLWLGRAFPFNRWGWNVIVRARRQG